MILTTPSNTPMFEEKGAPSPTASLILPSVSISCEDSSSSRSNDTVETDSDTVSESHAVFSFGSHYPQNNRKRRRSDHTMGQAIATFEHPQSNVWDDSSWSWSSSNRASKKIKKDLDGLDTSSTTLMTTTHLNNQITFFQSKHSKVQGLLFATREPLKDCRKQYKATLEQYLVLNICHERSSHYNDNEKRKSFFRIPHLPNVETRSRNLKESKSLCTVESPTVLYRWLRERLRAGLVRSSFDYLHQLLRKYYDDVIQVTENLHKDGTHRIELATLASLKERLAVIWCVYAHFILEVGCLVLDSEKEKKCCSGEYNVKVESDVSFDDFSNLAITILLHARGCPFVGNHGAIGVSLGRLIVSSTIMKNSTSDSDLVELSRKNMIANIQSAMDICRDCIDLCRIHGHKNRRFTIKSVSKATFESLSNFQLKCDKQNWKEEARIDVQGGVRSILQLPLSIRNRFPPDFFLSKEMKTRSTNTIRDLCKELNRWSRLGEKLENNLHNTVRLRPCCNSEVSFAVSELPLYASIHCLSDPLNHYMGMPIPGKEINWHW